MQSRGTENPGADLKINAGKDLYYGFGSADQPPITLPRAFLRTSPIELRKLFACAFAVVGTVTSPSTLLTSGGSVAGGSAVVGISGTR